jgi:membrane protease YdiL (CAAX protease family)
LLVCALQLLASLLLGGMAFRGSPALWYCLLAVVTGVCTVLPGAALGRRLMGKAPGGEPMRQPAVPAVLYLPVIVFGAALCFLGNAATAFVSLLGERAGFVFEGPPDAMPRTLPQLAMELLCIALLPAVVEELLLRGVVLPRLRPYGNAFAVASTAVLFALLHQNLVQAPMALISGLALGWAAVYTGRLWICAAIHFWNNAAAVLLAYAEGHLVEQTHLRLMGFYGLALLVLGAVCGLILYLCKQPRALLKNTLPVTKCALAFFFGSMPMVLALLYFIAMVVLNMKAV